MIEIEILSCGGTFDKAYGRGAGVRDLTFPSQSAAGQIVARLGLKGIKVSYDQDRAKDSLDMTDADREAVASWCDGVQAGRCVVVHGTDTMVQTAGVIARRCPGKVVVLTGALQPARMGDSDAEFNLGGAIIAAQACPPGTYIVMSGRIFPWNECRKNPVTGDFEPVANPE